MMDENIPGWFNAVLAAGALAMVGILGGITVGLVKYVISKNQNELKDMQESVTQTNVSVKQLTENVNAFVSTVKIHEFRINDNSEDIKELRKQLGAQPIVSYKNG